MAASIIRGKYLAQQARGDTTDVISDGALYQRDGRILEVGRYREVKAQHPRVKEVGGDGFLVIPGLINSHHHGRGVTGLQKGNLDDQLEYWILDGWGRREPDSYLDNLYAAMKLLRSGVTTVMFNFVPGPASRLREDSARALEAFHQTGQRVAFSSYIENQYRIVAEEDGKFLARLPSGLAARVRAILRETHISDEEYLAFFKALHKEHNDGSRVNVLLAPANAHWCSDRLLADMKTLATRYKTGIHIHLVESVYEKLVVGQFELRGD